MGKESSLAYHAFDPNDWVFRHNVKIHQGRLSSISLLRNVEALPPGVVSPYEGFTWLRMPTQWKKEELFEQVRREQFPDLPPRLGSLFLFPSLPAAERANQEWWAGSRVILPAQIIGASRAAALDARQLDAVEADWPTAARRYWSGETTADPRVELVVEGVVQLLGWEPWGHIGPPPGGPTSTAASSG